MTSFLSGPEFGKQIAYRFGLYLVLAFGAPFVLLSAMLWLNAASASASIIGFAATFGSYVRLVVFLLFLALLIPPCWRRMHSLGLPPYWGLVIPLLLFLSGGSFVQISVLAMVVTLWLASPPSRDDAPGLARFGGAGTTTAMLVIFLIAVSAVNFVMERWIVPTIRVPAETPLQSPALKLWHGIQWLKLFTSVSLCGLLAWMTFLSHKEDGDSDPSQDLRSANDIRPTDQAPASSPVVFGKR